jgi:FtsZ-binding cell division protein ZapB
MAPQTETVRSAAEMDELSALEARVTRAVELIQQLREERDEARAELIDTRQRLAAIESEQETLRTERKVVRTRIEKLLGQMDLLSSES